MNYNKAIIVGRVTGEPDIKTLPSGTMVANFSMATNRVYTVDNEKKEEVTFHNIIAFGRLAELIDQYVNKGNLLLIEGRLQTRSWEDNKTGEKKYKTEIILENLQFAPKATNGKGGSSSRAPSRSRSRSEADDQYDNFGGDQGVSPRKKSSRSSKVDDDEVNPEEIPF